FMILDGKTVWTGSWNYTERHTYNFNANALVFETRDLVKLYQNEFNQLFERQEFSSPASPTNRISGIPIEVYFSPNDQAAAGLTDTVKRAQSSIYFLVFSFT